MSDIGGKAGLLGSNAKEAALVDQWVHFAEHEIGVPMQNTMQLIFGAAGPFHREVRIPPTILDTHVRGT